MDKLVKMLGPLSTAWGRLNSMQKAAITMACLLTVVALIVAVGMASRPQYTVLFSNLSPTDAGAIVEKLKEAKTPYQLSAGGTAVEVPSQQVYDLRLQLAGDGLPQGGTIGFEIFDKSSFGMTEFTQKLNYQRALQGELSKTISEMDPISQARVHLSMPEQSLYSDKEKESTASVVVKLRPGQQLNTDQVASITHLVSAAVEGLKPNNVAVVDTAGNLLSDAGMGSMSASGLRLSASQIQMQRQYESQMGRDIQGMLEKVLGPGKAVVRVSARMNFDSVEMDRETYEPNADGQGVLSSSEVLEENYKGSPRGMPGAPVLSPTVGGPRGAVSSASASGDNYSRTQTNQRFEVSKKVEHITQAPGKVERLSVAVLVDGQVDPTLTNTIRQTVAVGIGLDATRGDQVTVDSLPFDNTVAKQQEKEMQQAASRDMYLNGGKWVVAALLGIAFMLFLFRFMGSFKPVEITESYSTPLSLQQAEAAAVEGEGAPMLDFRSEEPARPRDLATGQAIEAAKSNPEDVARIVRSWLAEPDS